MLCAHLIQLFDGLQINELMSAYNNENISICFLTLLPQLTI